MMQLILSKHCL